MNKVFMLYHIRDEDSVDEDIKLIGIYTTYELAHLAQMRVCNKPGFIDYPDGFSIIENPLDCDNWVDGFII